MKLYNAKAIAADKIKLNSGDILYKIDCVLDWNASEFGSKYCTVYKQSCPKPNESLKVIPVGGKWKVVEV